MTVYVLVISLLLVLACSRIPNPFSSVSALPIARAARLAPTAAPPSFSQNLFAIWTGQSSGQAFGNGGAELEESPILGPVNPAMVLAAIVDLTQTAIAGDSVERILGGLATPLAAVEALQTPNPVNAYLGQVTPTPTPSYKLPPDEIWPTETPEPERSVGGGGGGGGGVPGPVGGGETPTTTPFGTPTPTSTVDPSLITPTTTPTSTPTAEPTPTETPEPDGSPGGGPPGPTVDEETPTATPFGTPTPTRTVDPSGEMPTATRTRTPRPTRTPNPAYPTLTPIPEGAFLDIVDIRLSPGSYTGINPGSELTFEIWVEPNGQEVSVVQVVLEFDPDVLRVRSSDVNPDAPLSVRLVPDDSFDNDEGVIVMSISQDKNATESPSTMFLMGTIRLKVNSSIGGGTSTSVDFVRYGDVRTVVGIEGAEVTDELFGASVMIELPATPTPVP